MNKKCLECTHESICKYTSDFEKIDSKIKFMIEELKKEGIDTAFINFEVKCGFFDACVGAYKVYDPSITLTNTTLYDASTDSTLETKPDPRDNWQYNSDLT